MLNILSIIVVLALAACGVFTFGSIALEIAEGK